MLDIKKDIQSLTTFRRSGDFMKLDANLPAKVLHNLEDLKEVVEDDPTVLVGFGQARSSQRLQRGGCRNMASCGD